MEDIDWVDEYNETIDLICMRLVFFKNRKIPMTEEEYIEIISSVNSLKGECDGCCN